MAREMEGKLNDVELKKALFEKMHGNSAPGLDGFTVNWLRTFWPELATITKNALNDCFHKGGLTGLLKTAIIRLLRKGLKDPTMQEIIGPYHRCQSTINLPVVRSLSGSSQLSII